MGRVVMILVGGGEDDADGTVAWAVRHALRPGDELLLVGNLESPMSDTLISPGDMSRISAEVWADGAEANRQAVRSYMSRTIQHLKEQLKFKGRIRTAILSPQAGAAGAGSAVVTYARRKNAGLVVVASNPGRQSKWSPLDPIYVEPLSEHCARYLHCPLLAVPVGTRAGPAQAAVAVECVGLPEQLVGIPDLRRTLPIKVVLIAGPQSSLRAGLASWASKNFITSNWDEVHIVSLAQAAAGLRAKKILPGGSTHGHYRSYEEEVEDWAAQHDPVSWSMADMMRQQGMPIDMIHQADINVRSSSSFSDSLSHYVQKHGIKAVVMAADEERSLKQWALDLAAGRFQAGTRCVKRICCPILLYRPEGQEGAY